MKKMVSILVCIVIALGCIPTVNADAAVNYSKYSNKKICWALKRNKKHNMPTGPNTAKKLLKYDTFYAGAPAEEDKVVYLTFDCGYENGYTSRFLDTLKKYDVKAAFFVTTEFLRESPKVVKRMKKEGHVVGNHSTKHLCMPTMSTSSIKYDILNCQRKMKAITGYKMDPFFRPPMGEFSARTLRITQDLGYTSILWSNDYYDWEPKHQPSVDYVIKQYETYHHNGMLPLIHCVSKSNCKALPKIIKTFKKNGYRFGSLYELPGQNQNLKKAKKK